MNKTSEDNFDEEEDIFNIRRFIVAQDADNAYDRALEEINGGFKTGHWIWYVFPQLKGLGTSEMCQKYGISGLDEAKAYLANRTLYTRLINITNAVTASASYHRTPPMSILGEVDTKKFYSSMTLFWLASEANLDRIIFSSALAANRRCLPSFCEKTMEKCGDAKSVARIRRDILWVRRYLFLNGWLHSSVKPLLTDEELYAQDEEYFDEEYFNGEYPYFRRRQECEDFSA